ncbi:MAG: CoB--CoM heterodisulfide reductase iron-sulfur subunit A family protein, partial [Bacteroidetes bacterium]|nr:CoB--CoM heterodisulfide reductase iron-sulfur subunit A family protein [Bacteroidota bacterium]
MLRENGFGPDPLTNGDPSDGDLTNGDPPVRIGVYVCHCGTNIARTVDVERVTEKAGELPGVTVARDYKYMCSDPGQELIKEDIEELGLNRIVVASCSPNLHEGTFRGATAAGGLNPFFFQMVNIREHDSWIHKDPKVATEKTKFLVQMGVAKARFLEPETEPEIDIIPASLVVGGGVSGLSAALSVAKQGFDVYLVEKEAELGGVVRDLYKVYPTGDEAKEFIEPLIAAVENHERIKVFTSSVVSGVSGFVGSFHAQITSHKEETTALDIGTIIVATGAEALEPAGYYGYGINDQIMTQLELEKLLKEGSPNLPERVVMIQCVGAMEENGRTYCSRICCGVALKNAIQIKSLKPETDVYILYRDIQAYGVELEEYYRDALRLGIKFVNFVPEEPPKVSILAEGGFEVKVQDKLIGIDVTLDAGMVVLSTPLVQREEGKDLAFMLRVPIGADGFFLEAHPKMRPVDFSSEG